MSNTNSVARLVPKLTGIARDGAVLVRQEIALARQETKEKLTPAVRSTGMVVGGGVLAIYGSSLLLQAAVRVLSTKMPLWLASLLSGGALTLGGLLLAGRGGRKLKDLDIVPKKTINSLREDKEWLVTQIRSRMR